MIKINRSIDQVIYHLGIENVFVDEKYISEEGIINLLCELLYKSSNINTALQFYLDNQDHINLDILKNKDFNYYQIIESYNKEKSIKVYNQTFLSIYYQIEIDLSSIKKFHHSAVSILKSLDDYDSYQNNADYGFYTNDVLVINSIFSILKEYFKDDHQYYDMFFELSVIKFRSYDFHGINRTLLEKEAFEIQKLDFMNSLKRIIQKKSIISEKEYDKISDILSSLMFYDKEQHKNVKFLNSSENIKFELLSKLDMKEKYSYLINKHQLGTILKYILLYESETRDEKMMRLFVNSLMEIPECFFNDYDNLIDHISYIDKLLDNAKDGLENLDYMEIYDFLASKYIDLKNTFDLIQFELTKTSSIKRISSKEENEDVENDDYTNFLANVLDYSYYNKEIYEHYDEILNIYEGLFSIKTAIDNHPNRHRTYYVTEVTEDLYIDLGVTLDYLADIIHTYYAFDLDIQDCLKKFIIFALELNKEEDNIQEELININYDFESYSEEKLEEVVITKLENFANSSYYKNKIVPLKTDEIQEKIKKSLMPKYNWHKLLMQAEYLLGFYDKSDFSKLDSVSFDWTFIYILLAKSIETLVANYVEIKMKEINEKGLIKEAFIYRFNKRHKIDVSQSDWRSDLTIRDYQQIINIYIVPFMAKSHTSGLLNERIKSLFREDRNKLLHDEILLGFNQLKKYHFENIYHLIYLIISEI
ncbi:MAG: hypothetical protein WC152_05995 [Candidatus Izemoplasmatales bacterium]